MKTEGRRESENIEDRRGQSAGRRIPGGRITAGGGLGLLVIIVLSLVFGIDPRQLIDPSALDNAGTGEQQASGPYQETPEEAKRREMIAVVLAETEDAWTQEFARQGATYEKPVLVLFSGGVESACGFAQSASGPFYCPGDHKVFLDLSFFDDMSGKLGASGDFAMAYVVAHEIGHHVQTLLGTSAKVAALREQDPSQDNALSVKMELQADCYAGIWAAREKKQANLLEAGDIEEALNAASAVGDDRLQKAAQGYVVPESFTHGSSAQRVSMDRQRAKK
jgi:predicted metalloprotease